jgi:choline-glycine betaine transporter
VGVVGQLVSYLPDATLACRVPQITSQETTLFVIPNEVSNANAVEGSRTADELARSPEDQRDEVIPLQFGWLLLFAQVAAIFLSARFLFSRYG